MGITMPLDVLETAWPWLAVLGYLLFNAVLAVLASHHRHAVRVHDLAVEVRRRRLEYDRRLAGQLQHDTDVEFARAA